MNLTKDEQETLIYQNASDRTKWIIYTDDKTRIREFRKKKFKELCSKGIGFEFEIEDAQLTIRKKRERKTPVFKNEN